MKPATRAVHAGDRKAPAEFTPVTTPIHNASSYFYACLEDIEKVFAAEVQGQGYARYGNPTNEALEELVAALEGADAACAAASGMAALYVALSAAMTDRRKSIVAGNALLGDTFRMLGEIFEPMGVEITYADPCDLDAFQAAIEETSPGCVFVESISNPPVSDHHGWAVEQVVADYSSTGLTGKGMIVVTPESRQPLEGGTYFIALGLFTTGIDVDGTITATVTPGPSPPEIGISSAAFTFTADVGSNPPPQTIEVRNTGSGTLHYGLMTDKPWLWVSPDQGESMGEADPIEVSVNTEGLAANTYNGTITISELDEAATLLRRLQATPVVIPVTLIVSEPDSGMGPTVGGIVSSASFAPNAPAAPGSILAVFGQNFGMLNDGFLFPSTQFEAEGVSVLFDGTAAPLFGVFGDTPFPQINVLAPTNLPEMGQVQVEVTNSAGTSDVFILPMAPASTGIYRADPVGRMYAAALVAFDPDVPNRGPTRHLAIPASTAVTLGIPTNCKADGVAPLADCGEPVSPGVILQIFVTGLGKATPGGDPAGDPLPAGELAPGGYNTVGTPVVTIGGIQAIVDFSGLAPGFSGLYQINARVPLGAQAGDQIPLTIRMPSEMEGDTSNIAIAGP